ncbi:hypothetical protein C4K00_1565 [Pseudomonas synxantha]|nr:hypothetical protein C4K00_1565 [Pseudomonas synxantha]
MQQLLEISAWPANFRQRKPDVIAGHDKHLEHYAEGPGRLADLDQHAFPL